MRRNNKEANIQAGLDKNSILPVPVLSRAPSDYTWHHMEDGKSMMLVDKKVHAEFSHKGGVSLKNN
ncbi:HNH endonuclease signature motif containing protein [Listeria booriae]|uniref:HNH endonuclease signature motif containing protein n=1 Tax=Listeria booriae TaxID=1552123 RepID=UPI002893254D|nr:HNH endonuclease [Listeria booriae]